MIKIKLSICIATYNRANFISITLNSIINQLTPEVEIIIVDGNSTDNTMEVVKPFQDKCSQVKYFKLKEKGGFGVDYNKAVEYASGDMCWLFCDDDLIKQNSISKILSKITPEVSLIILNAEIKNLDLSLTKEERKMKIYNDVIFDESEWNLLFECIIPYITYIGAVIINRNLWLERDKEKYFESDFIHVGVIFQKLIPNKTIVIADPLIEIRSDNAQWTSKSFEVWMIKWPNLLSSFESITTNFKNELLSKYRSLKLLKETIIFRRDGFYNIHEYKRWYKKSNSFTVLFKTSLLIISIIPPILFYIIVFIVVKFKKLINIINK